MLNFELIRWPHSLRKGCARIAAVLSLLFMVAPLWAVCDGGTPNGVLQAEEECDDNNSAAGDGCASDCTVESGWFCGGAPGDPCEDGSECDSGVCSAGTCTTPTCSDSRKNQDETGVDCGGATCPACPDGWGCLDADDCTSGVCTDGICQTPTCSDGVKNQDEADIDCGGATCSLCPDGSDCVSDGDCASGLCTGGTCTAKLGNGEVCTGGSQCTSGHCVDGVCCDRACGSSCDACDLAGSEGTCTVREDGAAGDPVCGGHLLCSGTNASCPSTCLVDEDCEGGHYCDGGTCTALPPQVVKTGTATKSVGCFSGAGGDDRWAVTLGADGRWHFYFQGCAGSESVALWDGGCPGANCYEPPTTAPGYRCKMQLLQGASVVYDTDWVTNPINGIADTGGVVFIGTSAYPNGYGDMDWKIICDPTP